MKLILLGPPGAGKGTQANLITEKYNVAHISTGDVLREAVKNKTEVGLHAKSFMDKGELVPDSVVIEIIKQKLIETHQTTVISHDFDAAGGCCAFVVVRKWW